MFGSHRLSMVYAFMGQDFSNQVYMHVCTYVHVDIHMSMAITITNQVFIISKQLLIICNVKFNGEEAARLRTTYVCCFCLWKTSVMNIGSTITEENTACSFQCILIVVYFFLRIKTQI